MNREPNHFIHLTREHAPFLEVTPNIVLRSKLAGNAKAGR